MSALRSVARSPRYALIAGSIIALGLGACTAVFSVFDSVILRARPGVVDSATLVDIGRTRHGSGFDNLSFADYVDLRDGARAFADIAALRLKASATGVIIEEAAELARTQWVTPNFFRVLGTRVALGRDFRSDSSSGAEVILSDRYWRTRFNADPAVVGRTIVLNRISVAIIGVTEPGFSGNSISNVDLWAPVTLRELANPEGNLLTDRAMVGYLAVGRLAAGATLEQARVEASLIARRLEAEYPATNSGRGFALATSSRLPGDEGFVTFIGLLGVLVGLCLAVACTNIGGLMLARTAVRQREFAVRTALGAERRQLVRLLLGEHLALFLLATPAGILIAAWLVSLLQVTLERAALDMRFDISLSPTAVLFSFSLALLAGVGCGLGPSFAGTRFELLAGLRTGQQPVGSRFFSGRNLFLVVQLTVSLALLGTAGLLTLTLQRLAAASTGYDLARVEAAALDVSIGGLGEAEAETFRDTLMRRISNLPQVESTAWSVALPLGNATHGFGTIRLPGAAADDTIRAGANLISPDYFITVGLPLVRGRGFNAADTAGAALVVIINETFARNQWPGQDAIGQILLDEKNRPMTVVGVARDAKYAFAGETPRNFLYYPIAQRGNPRFSLFVRSRDGLSLAPTLRQLVRELQPGLPVTEVQSLEEIASRGLLPFHIAGAVAAGAGLLSLFLSATGVYGATMFWASSRTKEFGLRNALGATTRQLISFALAGTLRTLAVASLVGLLLAVGLVQIVSAAMVKIPVEPWVLLGITAFFAGLVLIAAWLPARRVARVDPMTALRAE